MKAKTVRLIAWVVFYLIFALVLLILTVDDISQKQDGRERQTLGLVSPRPSRGN